MKNEKNTILSVQFQNPIEKSEKQAQLMPLTHKDMSAHFSGLVHALQ
jgi:hypothetical protein